MERKPRTKVRGPAGSVDSCVLATRKDLPVIIQKVVACHCTLVGWVFTSVKSRENTKQPRTKLQTIAKDCNFCCPNFLTHSFSQPFFLQLQPLFDIRTSSFEIGAPNSTF